MRQQGLEYKVKLQRHMANIRRDARQKIIKQMRQTMYFETEPIHKIVQRFKLAPKQFGDYSIRQVMNERYDELIHVTAAMSQMRQEKQNREKREISIDAHIQFWAFLYQQLFIQKQEYNDHLQKFFILFIKHNSQKQLNACSLLASKVVNTLEIAMASSNASRTIKNNILDWVEGTNCLTLILNSLPNEFIYPTEYPRIYLILKQSLAMGTLQKLNDVSLVVKEIAKHADYDQTYGIFELENDLMVGLMQCIVQFVENENVEVYADAVIYLMDSYDHVIFDYARGGVALLATRMLISRCEPNMCKGLEIIKYISQVQSKQCTQFLLQDKQLNEAGLWVMIFKSDLVLFNRNVAIKREGYAILSTLMANGDRQDTECLDEKANALDHKSLIQIVNHALRNQEDVTIIRSALIMLSVLLYYSKSYQQQSERNDNQILTKVIQFSLESILQKLLSHTNERLSKYADQILQNISTLKQKIYYNNDLL